MTYLLLKTLHVVAVVLFLGNIITGLFWKSHAERSGDPRLIAHAFEGIIRSDRWFTMPGVLVIIASGFAAAVIGGIPILRTGWLFWSLVLFGVSGMAFMFYVAPLQRKIAEIANTATRSGDFDLPRYHALARRWEYWGLVAMLTPLAAAVLMVLKPQLPGL